MKQKLVDSYGHIFEESLMDEMFEVGLYQSSEEGEVLLEYGQNVRFMPLLIEGAIKILRQDKEGDELLLYFLESGDTCTMTMTCCMGNAQSEIRAVVEKESELLLRPVEKMQEWITRFQGWRAFVFESYNNRFNELLEAIDNLAFYNMHDRLHKYLKDRVLITKSTVLEITHQEIAYDLHSSRVVISRLLKRLENEEKIRLSRNKIEVIDF
jgi:CRP/FNR family transcriptional regulator